MIKFARKTFAQHLDQPFRRHDTDAGLDLRLAYPVTLHPGSVRTLDLGVCFEIPPGHFGLLKERSSLAQQGMVVLGGVIDQGYTGEIRAVVANISDTPIFLAENERVVQIILIPCAAGHPVEVAESDLHQTPRSADGFGSSGQE